jgi:predicted secreted protein with PEFG-CTERM motif
MKTIAIGSIFAALALLMVVPSAFADHAHVDVSIAPGSQTQGCEVNNECYVPYEAVVDVGGEVTWTNDDSAAHTVTSGTVETGPQGVFSFDQDLILAGRQVTHVFDSPGEVPYYCMVHPWMKGIVIVQEAMAEEEHEEEMEHEEGMATTMTTDGSVMVTIKAGAPAEGEEMALTVEFTDADGNLIEHVNYDITAVQDETEVLAMIGEHSHNGMAEYTTDALGSDSAVDFQITVLGLGLPDDEANWTGPSGETVSLNVVPEFGPIAMIILAVAIVSIVAVTARSKVIPKL